MSLNNYGFLGDEILEVKKEILAINKGYFDCAFRLNEFLQKVKFKINVNDKDVQKVIIAILLIKAMETMQAVYILCSLGMKNDANILLRALFESIVGIKYCQISEANAKQYLARDSYERRKRLNSLLNSETLKERIKVSDEEKVRILAEIKDELDYLGNPTEISIEQMCKDVGEHDLYNTFYRTMSDAVHSGPRIFQKFFSVESDVPKFIWGPNDKDVSMLLITASELILKVLPKVIDEFCPEEYENANNLINEFNGLASKKMT